MRSRIAVIGAGVSGLVAAYLLSEAHEVTVFEANDYPGGHSNTVRVDTEEQTHWVDTGFVMFNDRNYPAFERLLHRLEVAWRPCSSSFSVSDRGRFEYSTASVNGLFASRAHLVTPSFYRMVADLLRFQREAPAALVDGGGAALGDWLEGHRYSAAFIDRLLVPVVASVWSAPPDDVWRMPVGFVVDFFSRHGLMQLRNRPKWRSVAGGSRRYVQALCDRLGQRLRLSSPVASIRRGSDHVCVTRRGGERMCFDEVVIATHSDQALALLHDADRLEREVLGAIAFSDNEVVLHTDRRLLPRQRRAWASWNYHLLGPRVGAPTLTYHMNRLQGLTADREFCVTLNRGDAIDPSLVLRRLRYAHPVYTTAGWAARGRRDEISGRNRTHFCGAYWGWGFHEDGVVAANAVAARLGAKGI